MRIDTIGAAHLARLDEAELRATLEQAPRKVDTGAGRPHRFVRGLIVAAVAVAAFATSVMPAQAYTDTRSGTPGSVSLRKTLGITGYSAWRINSDQIVAYRSPASSGTQKVTITWRVWEYQAGQWYLEAKASATHTVYAGQYVTNPGWYVNTIPGLYATDLRITWRTSGGTFLGERFEDYVHSGDYACGGPGLYCSIYYFGGQYGLSLA